MIPMCKTMVLSILFIQLLHYILNMAGLSTPLHNIHAYDTPADRYQKLRQVSTNLWTQTLA